jgi:hypothetical protein
MKLLIMQFYQTSYHFIPLRCKYSPQHPVLKYPQSELLTVFLNTPQLNKMLQLFSVELHEKIVVFGALQRVMRKHAWYISVQYPGISLVGLRKTTKHLSQDTRYPGRDSIWGSPECNSRGIIALAYFLRVR